MVIEFTYFGPGRCRWCGKECKKVYGIKHKLYVGEICEKDFDGFLRLNCPNEAINATGPDDAQAR